MGKASRGRGSTFATLPTRTGPLPTKTAPAVPLWAEDPLACPCPPGEAVAEAAPAGVNTPGAGTLADEQATGAADVTGAAGPGSTPASVTPAAVKKDPTTASRCTRDPDRLRNSLAWSGKEGMSRGMELPATAGAGSTYDPELPRSR